MRLPRCITHSLISFIDYPLTFGVAILILGMVPVIASASPQQLECAPQGLAFGATVVGQTETLPVTLTNGGDASATISGVTASNSGFTASSLSLPLTLLPGQSVETTVTFTPTTIGWAGGMIKFISDAANPILPLPVGGTGVSSEAVTASPSVVTFGQAALGTKSTQPVVITNARAWRVILSALHTTGAGFSVSGPSFPLTLEPGQSATLNVAFSPSSAATVGGSLFFSGVGLVIPLNGIGVTAGQLTANPASLSFGSVPSGSSVTLTDSFTNTGGTNVTISRATITGAGFSLSGLTLPMVLFPGASVTFYAEFAPQGAVSATGGIAVVSNASNGSLNVSLSGTSTALGQLTLAPTALNFGNTTVGTTVSQTSSLSASGSSVTVSSATLSSAEFSLTGITLPVTIPAGQSMPVTLTFAPQTSGTASAVLSLASNAANTPTQALSGVGMAPAPQSVSLSWADGNSGVAGYNVFRSSVSGGPYAQINSGSEPTPAFTDSSVVAGQTYYYVTTAINGSGEQSAYSNEATAVVPNP
jgi:hypothetical protein